MKDVLRGITFFLTLIVLLGGVIMPQDEYGYNAAIRDKYDRLVEIDEPKIVLVGDSNVAFGIDSQKIEDTFNMPTINLGLHGGIGQTTLEAELAKKNICDGDIIILLPADYGYDHSNIRDGVLGWMAVENDIELWKTFQLSDLPIMVKAFPTYLKKVMELWTNHEGNRVTSNIYNRNVFNEYGDVVFDRPQNIMENGYIENDGYNSKHLSEEMKQYWNNFNEIIIENGGTVVMSVPPILKEDLKISNSDLEKLEKELKEELEFPVISNLEDYIFPKEYFFDTNFHLNNSGRMIRTNLLINDLRNYGV